MRSGSCLLPERAAWAACRSADASARRARRPESSPSFNLVEQSRERSELAIAGRDRARVADEARRVLEILRLAVAVADAREDAEHLAMALQPHPLQRAPELREVRHDRQCRALRLFPVAHAPVEHPFLVPADESVAQ